MIHIVRELGVSGSRLNVYLDGNQIARISAGEAMTLYVKPGRHLLSVRPLFSPPASRRLILIKGDATTIRITDRTGKFELKPAHRSRVQ